MIDPKLKNTAVEITPENRSAFSKSDQPVPHGEKLKNQVSSEIHGEVCDEESREVSAQVSGPISGQSPGQVSAQTRGGLIQRRVKISGMVQGVGFRMSTFQEARRHPELRGFVRNLPDGRVEALFSGPERQVLEMVSWCAHGPKTSQVDRLEVIEEQWDALISAFEILK